MLVLGSLPGDESLRRQQYYGNPRNQFWEILRRVFDDDPGNDYQQRLAFLKFHGIALWDVIGSAEREGSLDSAIRAERPNDFAALFAELTELRTIALNGSKAAAAFARHVRPAFPDWLSARRVLAMPSTSAVPSRRYLDVEAKAAFWKAICTG